jgi:flagellar M-ring protein FliF
VKLPEGTVKRISVSLIVDHSVRWEGTGAKAKKIVEAPSPEKLKSIHDLVAGLVGFTQERGDQLIVESLPFESTLNAQPVEQLPPAPAAPQQAWPSSFQDLLKNKTLLIEAGGGLLVLILLLGVAARMLRRGGKAARRAEMTPEVPAAASAPDVNKSIEGQLAERAALKQQQEADALNALKLPPVTTKKTEVLTKHVAEQAKKDATGAAQVLRTWMTESGGEK